VNLDEQVFPNKVIGEEVIERGQWYACRVFAADPSAATRIQPLKTDLELQS